MDAYSGDVKKSYSGDGSGSGVLEDLDVATGVKQKTLRDPTFWSMFPFTFLSFVGVHTGRYFKTFFNPQ